MDKRVVVRGAVAGVLAGLVASYAMNKFQGIVSRLNPQPDSDAGDPSTVKVAERVAGRELSKTEKPTAGNQVHYAFGALLGLVYGSVAAVGSVVSIGFGLPFGLVVAVVADEMAVPAAGLSGPAWGLPPSTHAYTVASHLVFGGVLEGARRLLLRVV